MTEMVHSGLELFKNSAKYKGEIMVYRFRLKQKLSFEISTNRAPSLDLQEFALFFLDF